MNPSELQQKAVVLGAGRTFGLELVERLAAEGYLVYALDTPAPTFGAAGSNAVAIEADPSDCIHLAAVYAQVGVIDTLIVNVPAQRDDKRFLEVTDDDLRSALRYSLTDVVGATQAALPYLAAGARIVHVTSRGYLGAWGGAHTMAGSAALVAMTRSMALELGGRDIAVNAVAADFTHSKYDLPQARRSVAHAVAYLASADVGVSGNTLLIDGCRGLRMSESRRQLESACAA